MTKLDCNVTKCSYNEENCCRRNAIDVQGKDAHYSSETCCGSFSTKGCDDSCKNSIDGVYKETVVRCNAVECVYNKDKHCSANHIGITGRNADSEIETECETFAC